MTDDYEFFDVDWVLMDFEDKKKPAPKPVIEAVAPSCPKCGKALKSRGQHLHIRACKADVCD